LKQEVKVRRKLDQLKKKVTFINIPS